MSIAQSTYLVRYIVIFGFVHVYEVLLRGFQNNEILDVLWHSLKIFKYFEAIPPSPNQRSSPKFTVPMCPLLTVPVPLKYRVVQASNTIFNIFLLKTEKNTPSPTHFFFSSQYLQFKTQKKKNGTDKLSHSLHLPSWWWRNTVNSKSKVRRLIARIFHCFFGGKHTQKRINHKPAVAHTVSSR